MSFSFYFFGYVVFFITNYICIYFFYVQSLRKGPVQQEKKTNTKKKKKHQPQWKKLSSDEDDDDESSSSSSSSKEDVVIKRHKKSAHSDSESDIEDEDELMDRLPENPKPLLDFAGASQGILLLLVLKQHLKHLYGFSDRYSTLKHLHRSKSVFTPLVYLLFDLCYSKIQKYSPTESAKVYDKNVNRKSKVHFNPRQTLEYLKSDTANMEISFQTKRNIVKQYLDVSI